MNREVVLLLGSNMGERAKFIERAIDALENEFGKCSRMSSVYESQAWGFDAEQDFLNRVVVFQTNKSPLELLETTQRIEVDLGRVKDVNNQEYQSRTIDIDILFLDQMIMRTRNLEIPHPKLHLRKFTLTALAEIDPQLIHPVYQQSVANLLLKCKDDLWVKKFNEV